MSRYFLKVFFALLLLLLDDAGSILGFKWATKSGEAKCLERERQALLRFKQGFQDDHGILSTWRDVENNGDCCKWRGIECNNITGHIQMLDLRGSDTHYLRGIMNITLLMELQNMEYLDLSSNDFRYSEIPEILGSVSNLIHLDLSFSVLDGKIPCQLGNLSQLQYLNLSGNDLVGEIPYQLGKLTHLQDLDLSGNILDGAIPYQLENLAQLQYLNLRVNHLVGAIPFQPGTLPMLQTLRLGGIFQLEINTGAEWLSNLSSLTNLDLTLNNLGSSQLWLQTIGKLLPNLRELRLRGCNLLDNDIISLFGSHSNISTTLSILDLSYNMLTSSSTFQSVFNFSFNLQELYLSGNNLVFSSPPNLNFHSLVILDLSGNRLTSSIFQGDFNFGSKLEKLYLGGCSLLDSNFFVPSASFINSSSSLVILDLSSNQLRSSDIFHWLTNFTTNLHQLYLFDNLLEGPIPDGFGNIMNSLEYLELSRNKLQGKIPTSLVNICTLQVLFIGNNNLSGEIPIFIQNVSMCNRHKLHHLHLSHNLSTFSSLITLDLAYNQLTGEIPKSMGLLSELMQLGLEGNSLNGDVNESHLTNLSKLKRLYLSDNSLSLKFGTSWIPRFQLDYLALSSCNLGPSFPSWLKTQNNLLSVDISNAGISDTVPKWFWHISQNTFHMNISYNSLRGTIPNLPVKFTRSPILFLTSNQFEGSIPPFLLKAVGLRLSKNRFSDLDLFLCGKSTVEALATLDVSNNQLEGQLPDCWNHLSSLQYLDLSNNKLSGKIPLSMGALVNLNALALRNNSLIGELPSSMRNWTNLALLDVGENKLSGPIPSWIGENLHQLVILGLRANRFFGSLPSQLCYLTQIKLLDLSENCLSEQIPTCLQNFTVLAKMGINNSEVRTGHSYHNNQTIGSYVFYISLMWKGIENVFKNSEVLLKSIDLSGNNLTGEIPIEIGSLFGLVSLNLSRNNLSGEITSGLGNLKSLEFLDLSRNHFSGKIPSSLAQIDRLSVLDLSNNHLYGKIPTGTQLQSFDASSYEGNLDLCGKPLDKNCPEDETPAPHVSLAFDHEDEESIFSGAFYMSLGLGFAAGFWGFIGPLLFCRSWRYSYIKFLNKLSDSIYVMVTLYVRRCRRWLTSYKH